MAPITRIAIGSTRSNTEPTSLGSDGRSDLYSTFQFWKALILWSPTNRVLTMSVEASSSWLDRSGGNTGVGATLPAGACPASPFCETQIVAASRQAQVAVAAQDRT